MNKTTLLLTTLSFLAIGQAESIGSPYLTTDEVALVQLINNHRIEHGKPPLTVSKSLTQVARWHVWDAINHQPFNSSCNLHSWSNARPDLWDGMCYTGNHSQAAQMWNKPKQITNNQYTADGYENAAWSSPTLPAQDAFNLWKNSEGHNNVMLEQAAFSAISFKVIGVAIENGYAFSWFGQALDPQGTLTEQPSASQPTLFANGFE